MDRAGSQHVRAAWRKQFRWLRRQPLVIAGASGTVIVASLPALLFMPDRLGMFSLGFVVAGAVAALWWFSLVSTNSYRLYVGGLAEEFTGETLNALRRHGWRHVNNIEFSDFDVDHVAVGPGGVLAVETKWTDKRWDVDATPRDRWLDSAIVQTRIGARRISLFLRAAGLDVPVVPVLVLWGPDVVDIDGGSRTVDGAAVLVGRQEALWRDELQGARIDEWCVEAAIEALTGFKAAHERSRADHA